MWNIGNENFGFSQSGSKYRIFFRVLHFEHLKSKPKMKHRVEALGI